MLLLASILIAFFVLTLGALALLDRVESEADKVSVDHGTSRSGKLLYYDAFAHQKPRGPVKIYSRQLAA